MDFTLDPSGGGVMKRFHGRWTIRPHPKDPEHSSLSTLDQVCAGVGEQQGITAPTAAGARLGWDGMCWAESFAVRPKVPTCPPCRTPHTRQACNPMLGAFP